MSYLPKAGLVLPVSRQGKRSRAVFSSSRPYLVLLSCAGPLALPAASQLSDTNPYSVQFVDVTRDAGIHFQHQRAASPETLYVETMESQCRVW